MGTTDAERTGLLMQALSNQFGMLQSARGSTIAESSSRAGLYLTSLSGAVVGLSFVAQASKFGETFFIFAVAALLIAVGFLRHQWSIWMHVAKALPMME